MIKSTLHYGELGNSSIKEFKFEATEIGAVKKANSIISKDRKELFFALVYEDSTRKLIYKHNDKSYLYGKISEIMKMAHVGCNVFLYEFDDYHDVERYYEIYTEKLV